MSGVPFLFGFWDVGCLRRFRVRSSVSLDSSHHVCMLLGIMGDCPIVVRGELHGSLSRIIDWRETLDELTKIAIIVVILPLGNRLGDEGRFKLADLKFTQLDTK